MTGRSARPTRATGHVVDLAHRARPRARLICVPYAGGGLTAFREWPGALPDWLEVCSARLPARESRLAEAADYTLESMVVEIAAELEHQASGMALPYALFGHSMGALICFELARELRRRGLPSPTQLFVSGRRAPQVPDPLPAICQLPPRQFLDRVLALGGLPPQVLARPELVELALPALQADFVALHRYRYREEERLSCDIHVFAGEQDPITSPELVHAWAEQTAGRCQVWMTAGDHFFIQAGRDGVLARITEAMAGACLGVRSGQ